MFHQLFDTCWVIQGRNADSEPGKRQEMPLVHMSSDTEVLIKPKAKAKTARPPMFRVLLMNDDYTPMDFVVEVLRTFFQKSSAESTRIMLEVHNKGSGLCGIYTRDVAETKAEAVIVYAQQHGYPLQCITERDDS